MTFPGFTFNHRYHTPELLEQSVQNVVTAVEYIRDQGGTFHLDPNRLCLWTCSGGGPHISFALRDQPEYVRCLVIYYAVLDVRPVESLTGAVGEKTALSRFLGIIIRMFAESGVPHHRPHFHAYYQNHAAVYSIEPVEMISGTLPRRQQRLVAAWAEIHEGELLEDWERLQSGQLPYKIAPLR